MSSTYTPIPLSTTFTLPSDCSTQFTLTSGSLLRDATLSATSTLTCYPVGYLTTSTFLSSSTLVGAQDTIWVTTTTSAVTTIPYFSPGILPAGWSSATASSVGRGASEAILCQSDFEYDTASSYCLSTISSPLTATVLKGGSSASESKIASGVASIAPIVIRYASSDPDPFATSTTSESRSSATGTQTAPTAGSAVTSGPAQTSARATASPAPSSGLSGGAKAGIGVGVAAIVILGILGGLLLWRRRRQTQAKQVYVEAEANEKAELATQGNRWELGGESKDAAWEVEARERMAEMPTKDAVWELDGNEMAAELPVQGQMSPVEANEAEAEADSEFEGSTAVESSTDSRGNQDGSRTTGGRDGEMATKRSEL